jgi:hypothetical protein
MSKAKRPPARKTEPSLRLRPKHTDPPVSQERRKRAEADTLPPPPLSSPPATTGPPPRTSGEVRTSMRVKKNPSKVTIDEVTADMTKDPRREE